MTEHLGPTCPDEARQFASQFLRQHEREILERWREHTAELSADLDDAARDAWREGLERFLPDLADRIEQAADEQAESVRELAERAYRHGIPPTAVSRGLRALKREVMRALVETPEARDHLSAVCDVVENEIDESRLQVSYQYQALAERRLRDSEQLTRFLLNNTQDAIFLVEVETARIVMYNASAVRLTGYSGEELQSGDFLALVPAERAEAVTEAFRRVAVSGTWRFASLPLRSADGRLVATAMQLTLVRQDAGRTLVQISARDTSSETAALAAQEKEAAYLRAFVTDTADAVLVLDAEDRIRSWNKGAEQIFGYTTDEVLNRHYELLVPPDLLAAGEVQRLDEIVRRDGFIRNDETTRLTKDGQRLDVSITRTAIFDPATGEYIGASAVVRDVSEKRRLEREATRKTQQLERLNRILEATSRVLDRGQTYRTIASHMEGLLSYDAMLVVLPESDGVRLRVLAGDDRLIAGSEEVAALSDTVLARPLATQEALRVDDLSSLSDSGSEDRRLIEQGYRSALVAPLVYHNESIGCLTLLHRGIGTYSEQDEALLGHLAGHFAGILENARRFEEERKRAAQFELISRVGAAAIANIGDVGRLMRSVVDTIQTDFGYYDVAVYEVDEDANTFRLRAQAGERRGRLGSGYEQPLHVGVFGEVLRTQASYVVEDVLTDSFYYNPSPEETSVRSEMCVPIRLGPRVFGVLDVESQRPGRFDRLDRAAMEALAGLLARCMEADENLRQMRTLQAMRQQIMEAVPSALILFDNDLRVKFVNRRYCEFFGQQVEQIMNAHVTQILPPSLLRESRFMELVDELREHHQGVDQREVRYFDFDHQERYADVRLRIVSEYETNIVVMLHDATTRLKRIYQLSMLQEIGEEMQQSLDVERLLRAILTCVTAGPGFGFNRASLLLVDPERRELVQRLSVGPNSAEEAGRIWRDIDHKKTLREFLREYDRTMLGETAGEEQRGPLATIPIPPGDRDLRDWRSPLMLRQDDHLESSPLALALRDLSSAPEVLVVPLVHQDNVLGLLLADNLFTGEPISRENIRMLTTFANQAGMALANAQAYDELRQSLEELHATQDELRQAEQLAGIGSVAAHVAHEIRNPLVSIGGFARRVQEKADQADYVRRRSSIIVREVERLEQILRNVADFTAPGKPELAPAQLNDLISEVVKGQHPVFEENGIRVAVDLSPALPVVMVDATKIQQVLLNLVKNAVQAMGTDGDLWITSRGDDESEEIEVTIKDSGPGIPADRIEEIFNPFFTSRSDGTGLGLALSRKICADHGGSLSAASPPEGGAIFTILLPRGTADEDGP